MHVYKRVFAAPAAAAGSVCPVRLSVCLHHDSRLHIAHNIPLYPEDVASLELTFPGPASQ